MNENALYIGKNSGSVSSYSASSGAAMWQTEEIEKVPTQLIVSVTGSIFATYVEDYMLNVLKYHPAALK